MVAPLASLKILDFTMLLPGPFATMWLADLGAEVVRIEGPSKPDVVRQKQPQEGGISAWHAVLNRSKRSLSVDLKQPEGVALVKRLVQTYDIVIEQFRPGVMDRLGVGYEALRAENPRLIYCAITGYGQDGPYRDRAGHDINYLALAGIAAHSGRQGEGPPPLGVQIADIGAGSLPAVVGVLSAVVHRQETGEGQFVDVSMWAGALAWNALAIADTLGGAEPSREMGLLNGGSFYDYYKTSDGYYLAVGSLEPQFWQGLCDAIGRPDLIGDGLMSLLNPGGKSELKGTLREIIAERTMEEWLLLFRERDICVEPVLSVSDAWQHPQVAARQMLVGVPRPEGDPQLQVSNPLRFGKTEARYRHIGSQLGEHSKEILLEIGYDESEIADLLSQRVVLQAEATAFQNR